MNCRFCNNKMEDTALRGLNTKKCIHHIPIRVVYNPKGSWHITNGIYRFLYFGGKTYIQKYNRYASEVKDFLTPIKRFDYEYFFDPKDFDNKLKTILTFL